MEAFQVAEEIIFVEKSTFLPNECNKFNLLSRIKH